MTALGLLACLGGLLASLNPCTLSVMIMALSSLLGKNKRPRHAGSYVAMFAVGIFISYGIYTLGLTWLLTVLPVGLVGYLGLVVALLLVVFGMLEVKDYFWYGKGWSFKLSTAAESHIHDWTKKHHSHWRGFLLGIYTAVRLSHYTLVLLTAFAVLFSLVGAQLNSALILCMWYVLPLLLIAFLAMSGADVHNLLSWKEEAKHIMRLTIGLLYIGLGWVLLVYMGGGLHLA